MLGIAPRHFLTQIQVVEFASGTKASAVWWFERTVGGAMSKPSLVSVVEDDRFFRESMKRLIRSRGYKVEVFPSAADFLGSSYLGETACLIADVHMPAMTGVELYRRLIDLGYAIPTILVTATLTTMSGPALCGMESLAFFGSRLMKSNYYGVFVRLSTLRNGLSRTHEFPAALGMVNLNMASICEDGGMIGRDHLLYRIDRRAGRNRRRPK
jgi:hypothetical protein